MAGNTYSTDVGPRCVKSRIYMGRSLLAEAHAEAIKRRRDRKQSELHTLVYKQRTAEPADLKLMAKHLPDAFREICELVAKPVGAASQTVDKLQGALARSAQEYCLANSKRTSLGVKRQANSARSFMSCEIGITQSDYMVSPQSTLKNWIRLGA